MNHFPQAGFRSEARLRIPSAGATGGRRPGARLGTDGLTGSPSCVLMCAALQEQAFELGERGLVLQAVEQPPIIPHMAETEGRRFPYEVIFR